MEAQDKIDIYFSFFAGTFIVLLLAVSVIVFFMMYRKRIFEKEIQLQKKESDHRLELLKTTIEVTEGERKRIAGDLHDEIGSHLTTVRMTLNAIKAKAINEPGLEQLATESKQVIDHTIESVRTIAYNLLPPGLEKFGFANTAFDLCQRLSKNSGIHIRFNNNYEPELSHDISLALYRILQELLTNSIKYASAKEIAIEIKSANNQICFKYADNGSGFDISQQAGSGLGLKNIQSRVAALNGTHFITTSPGNGFKIEINLPPQA